MSEIYEFRTKSLHQGIMNYHLTWYSDNRIYDIRTEHKYLLYSLNFNTCDLKEVTLVDELILSGDSSNIKIAIEIINILNENDNNK